MHVCGGFGGGGEKRVERDGNAASSRSIAVGVHDWKGGCDVCVCV